MADHTGRADRPADRQPSLNLRTDVPHSARMYDYYLGGKDNFPADRAAAEHVVKLLPTAPAGARANRRFLGRAVRFAARELGIRQFLDIGTGIPSANNTHEVAQSVAPDARVVYVDNDPIVLTHARALLRGTQEGRTAYLDADFRDPEKILAADETRELLDFGKPVALLTVALLHFVPDSDQPGRVLARLASELAPGSVLVLSHITGDLLPQQDRAAGGDSVVPTYRSAGVQLVPRSRAQVEAFFSGFDLCEPGIVPVHEWRPDGDPEDAALPRAHAHAYGAVGLKR
ncbi:SAM-dependent methyltransferase [Streptacidiphilus rugosus]|uniref:SAM-dependent methyltransferase n=1 Tax=Streptacidiphilus rugosus TaxID=405783 RepID=UPI0005635441|nr:SAM-dependent methyltransferase [Streptacidiphilus rugosus]